MHIPSRAQTAIATDEQRALLATHSSLISSPIAFAQGDGYFARNASNATTVPAAVPTALRAFIDMIRAAHGAAPAGRPLKNDFVKN